MEFNVRTHEDGVLDIEFIDERTTVPNLLKERLLEDDKVVTATVLTDHPVLANPRLVIRSSDGKPEAALKRAAATLRKELDGLEDAFLKAIA